jgi:mannitol-1-phosphate 5-dehydrogenase
MKAVHFGAGNIGRGFVGLLLNEAGYEVVFADVNAELIDALAAADEYRVRSIGARPQVDVVTGFRAINSATDGDRLAEEIATADVVTTAVGVRILPFVAPAIAAGLARRSADAEPLAVMACENAVGATDVLREAVLEAAGESRAELAARAAFANTAVDRIVPAQAADAGIDVTVEDFYEWVVERGPFGDAVPPIAGVTFVDDLAPYIERKLFTVNTGHATTAYTGYGTGATTISEAIARPEVRAAVEAALEETSKALELAQGLDAASLAAYRAKILDRFRNEELQDALTRVGRDPLRKLGRGDRFIAPAARLAEVGVEPTALLTAIGAALRFDPPEDEQAHELQAILRENRPEQAVTRVTGIEQGHPLFAPLVATFAGARAPSAGATR